MINTVIKGVDDDIEFQGFRGRYFYIFAASIVGLLLLTFILYAVGFSSFFLLAFSIFLGFGIYMYVKFLMDKNGKWGHLHLKHSNKPHYILHNTPFYKLIK